MKKVLMIFLLSSLGIVQVEAGTPYNNGPVDEIEKEKLEKISCKECSYHVMPSSLTCSCKQKNGNFKTTTLDLYHCSDQQYTPIDKLVKKGRISNCDGELTCGICKNK